MYSSFTTDQTKIEIFNSSDGTTWENTTIQGSGGIETDYYDNNLLLPLSNGDVLCVLHDKSADDLLSKTYHRGTQSWNSSWETIDGSFVYSATYESHFGGSLNRNTGNIYVVGANDISQATGDVETYMFNDTSRSWRVLTAVVNDSVTTQPGIFVDERNGDLYAVYYNNSIGTMELHYKNV